MNVFDEARAYLRGEIGRDPHDLVRRLVLAQPSEQPIPVDQFGFSPDGRTRAYGFYANANTPGVGGENPNTYATESPASRWALHVNHPPGNATNINAATGLPFPEPDPRRATWAQQNMAALLQSSRVTSVPGGGTFHPDTKILAGIAVEAADHLLERLGRGKVS